jgi:hypothetical protein
MSLLDLVPFQTYLHLQAYPSVDPLAAPVLL